MSSEPNEPDDAAAAAVQAVQNALDELKAKVFFEKTLTSSDASGSGRVVIPKAIAEQYFPRLEQATGAPVDAADTTGKIHHFKFRFWINNQSRMYLLEGMCDVMQQYKMVSGHVMVFAQKPDGSLVVAGRPSTKADLIRKPPIKRMAPASPAVGVKPRDQTTPGLKTKRKKMISQYGSSGAGGDMEAPADGIFRSAPGASTAASGIAPTRSGRWVAAINLTGELYQAFFECQEDAIEAFNAAGFVYNPIV